MKTFTKDITVLLVDDNEDDVHLMQKALDVSPPLQLLKTVSNGTEALAFLHLHAKQDMQPHLVFLDINMPCMNGFETLQAIKKDVNLQLLPVVMLTTSNREVDIEKAYEYGACSYLQKPFGFDELKMTIQILADYWSVISLPTLPAVKA